MSRKAENLQKFATDAAIIGGTATVYVVGANEILRRTSLGYTGRALTTAGVGVIGGLAGASYAPRIATGLFCGGLLGGLINGVNAVNMARLRGRRGTDISRADLPAGSTSTSTTTTQPTNGMRTQPTQALPEAQRSTSTFTGQPTRMQPVVSGRR